MRWTGEIKHLAERQSPRNHEDCPLHIDSLRNGLFLKRDDLTSAYAIIRHNIRTYRSAGVVAVVGGRYGAESELKKFEDSQDSSDRHEGWRYFIEKTNLKAGTDPAEATQHRQAELEGRESKALREAKASNFPPPDSQK